MPGSNRAVFLDRDGTIVEDPGYLTMPDQIKLLPGAAEALGRLRRAGFLAILATNQSAIARGMMTEQDLAAIHERLAEMLAAVDPDAKFDGIYYCAFHPEAKVAAYRQESYLRKPRPGMLFKAAREHQLDLGSCWMVGDSERDVQAGKTAGCRAIRVDHDPETETMADKVLPSLAAAAEMILATPGRTPLRTARHGEPPPTEAPAAATANDLPVPAEDIPPPPMAEPAEPADQPAEPLAESVEPESGAEARAMPDAGPMVEAEIVETSSDQASIEARSAEPLADLPGGPAQSASSAVPTSSSAAKASPVAARAKRGKERTGTPARPEGGPVQEITPRVDAEGPSARSAIPPVTPPGKPAGGQTKAVPARPTPAAGEPEFTTKPATAGSDKPTSPDAPAEPPRPFGGTKERLLREIEESRKRVLAGGEKPLDAITADKPVRPLNPGDVRHVLAEILQQLRQLNRGADRHAISATKIVGGLCQGLSWLPLVMALVTLTNDPTNIVRAMLWAMVGVFLQLASLFWFMVFRQE